MNPKDRKPLKLCVFQGEDFSFQAIYEDSNEEPIDLTGYTARMKARADYDSDTAVIDISTADDITITAATGTTTINLTNTLTASIPAGEYVYDVELVSSDNKVTKLLFGKITIMPEVTK